MSDGVCYYCGEMTNSLAGNPGEWPVMLCHKDEPGKVKHHHTKCVMYRLQGDSMIKEIVPGHEYECIDAGVKVVFQNGAVPDVGRNGWQNEELLEVMIARINFLNKMFSCRENAITVTKLEEALLWQQKRTNDRKLRGVEGKHEV